jgi:rod shape determining protein RodA
MKKYLKVYYKETLLLLLILTSCLLNIKKAYLLNSYYNNYFEKELIWILIGIIFYILIYKIKFKKLFKLRYILYGLNILMLIYVLIFSKDINGIKAWINIGPISFQPSELIKVTFPLVSIYLVRNKKYLINFILFLVPTILILIEPDTGNAILLFFIFIYILLNKKNKKYIFLFFLTVLLIGLSIITLFIYKPIIFEKLFNGSLYYRIKRLKNFNNNFQINNTLIGIGSAKLTPISMKKLLIYIPEGITDFAYAYFICNYGIIIGLMLVAIYFLFISFILKRYKVKRYYYSKKLIGSFLVIFTVQESYNILMNIGLLPIMGIPLPFFSYGGSNIITYFILYALATKKISSIEDKDNNNYKNNSHKVLVDKNN